MKRNSLEKCMYALLQYLKQLAEVDGVAGFEEPVAQAIEGLLGQWPDEIHRDPLGNLLALKKGTGAGPTLMLAAHMDEIGLAVSHIEKEGFIRFEKVGGVIDASLPGRQVRVGPHAGVIGVKPGHYTEKGDQRSIPAHYDMFIDMGLDNREEVESLGIAVGDPVVFDSPLRVLGGHRVSGRAVDDRLGCAVLLEVISQLSQERQPHGDIWFVFTVQEEVGLRGAQTAAFGIDPDYAIAVDTIPCGGTPDVPELRAPTRIGKGPVLPFISQGGARGHFMHPTVKKILLEAAERLELPYQPYLFYAGTNDASSIHLTRSGVPSGSVCLPRRYSHSPVEMADIRDAVTAVRLLLGVTQSMDQHVEMLRPRRKKL